MEDSNMHELVTVAAPLWQWALGVVVALWVWETVSRTRMVQI